MSKGCNPRPIDKQAFDSNYDKIFGQKPLSSLKPETEEEDGPFADPGAYIDDIEEGMLDTVLDLTKQ